MAVPSVELRHVTNTTGCGSKSAPEHAEVASTRRLGQQNDPLEKAARCQAPSAFGQSEWNETSWTLLAMGQEETSRPVKLPYSKWRLIGSSERNTVDHRLHGLQEHFSFAFIIARVDKRHRPFHQLHDRDVAWRTDL